MGKDSYSNYEEIFKISNIIGITNNSFRKHHSGSNNFFPEIKLVNEGMFFNTKRILFQLYSER
jgi:hypothetical protein